MNHPFRRPLGRQLRHWVLALAVACPAASLLAHDAPSTSVRPVSMERVSEEMASAATAFWNSLTPEQQKKAMYGFEDDERLNWHFIPKVRNGLPLREMTPAQRSLAMGLLATGLSGHGFTKVQQIMSLEAILKEIEAGPPKTPVRDPEGYFVTIFGKPEAKGTWGWRYEGHHLSVTFTIAGGKMVTGLPMFLGTNPGEVREGPRKGLKVLATEEDVGRKLVQSLTDDQKKKAIVSAEAPKDIITAAVRKVDMKAVVAGKDGLPAADMTPEQRDLLLQIIEEYARRHRGELASEELRKLHVAGFDKVNFAWAGGTEPSVGHYYRVVGPTFLIEYDNTQNNANHVHSVWRDPANDFGEDMLKKHYESATDHKK
ncbi:DUF3500 domain-containing protein [Humisphaera borealis]|uniref:DUF3500 domain-containing protein n=1 Tax=Humisphaera borealis TaxID=2807512 RepID=A0A7M2WQU4_9BACT|nr:DUF3500 domain-containing protein [Humisphaera borealis]QOV87779.1 DUF3500 domain-containing protein [Humisphaera borealis]